MLSEPMERAVYLLGDAWFCLNIKSNTWKALEGRGLVRHASLELPDGTRCYFSGLTRKGMDEYHKMKGSA